NAAATPGAAWAAAPVPCPPTAPPPACPVPALPAGGPPSSVFCLPGSPQPECQNPPVSTAAPGVPCTGLGCLPQPPTTWAPPLGSAGIGQTGGAGGEAECGISALEGCVMNAITGFFRGVVTAALNPLLELLSKTLLSTPSPQSLPRIGELWANSWQILLACYALIVLLAGVLVMAHETVQTQHSITQIAPRLLVGFLAGALSLWAASQAIEIANAVTQAVMGGGLDASSAGETLRNLVLGPLNGGFFVIFVGVVLVGMLLVLLVTYIVRVVLTLILV